MMRTFSKRPVLALLLAAVFAILAAAPSGYAAQRSGYYDSHGHYHSYRHHHSKTKGAIVGGVIGTVGGALVGGKTGAVVGAGAGAGTGYLVQKHRNHKHRTYHRNY